MNAEPKTSHIWKAETIRKKFRDWVRVRHGTEIHGSMFETTVLQGDCYAGRRFSLMGFSLLWLIQQQEFKVYGPDGSLVEPDKDFEDLFGEPDNRSVQVL